jgi:benzodiazapine receptor
VTTTGTGNTARKASGFWLPALAIIIATGVVAALGGMVSGGEGDPWYESLNRAPGNPPGWVFGVVWPILYGLMAASAVLVWRAAGSWSEASLALSLFGLQLVINLAWSYLFFGLHLPLPAFIDICLLWVTVALMIRVFARHSKLAAWMQIPYIVWLSFAAYLNAWIVVFNP